MSDSKLALAKRMLRAQVRGLRAKADRADVLSKSLSIEKAVAELPEYRSAQTVMLYASTRNEVHTLCLIESVLADGKQVALPHVTAEGTLVPLAVTDTSELERNHFGVLEPAMSAKKVPTDQIDLVIVPGVAFDARCRRLGMGKGCYDRLLPDLKDAAVVGLAFELQMVDEVPTEEHDLPVDAVVTEKRVLRRG